MIDTIINGMGKTSIAIITGSLLLAFLVLGFAWSRRRQKKRAARAAEAATLFRAEVLAELKGLYPIPRYVDEVLFEKFRTSIPKLQSAALEFRPFVHPEKRDSFDNGS